MSTERERKNLDNIYNDHQTKTIISGISNVLMITFVYSYLSRLDEFFLHEEVKIHLRYSFLFISMLLSILVPILTTINVKTHTFRSSIRYTEEKAKYHFYHETKATRAIITSFIITITAMAMTFDETGRREMAYVGITPFRCTIAIIGCVLTEILTCFYTVISCTCFHYSRRDSIIALFFEEQCLTRTFIPPIINLPILPVCA
jgi:hypothetical protein